jgi:N-acyl amino acid synthase of PEP-CTERM/exosortase system
MSGNPPPLATVFQQYFEPVLATTQALRDEVYRIRFQVYCQEMRFEPEEAFPDGREIDAFDAQSCHCLLRYRPSGRFIGCVRLVLNRPGDPSSQLPFERHCQHSLDRQRLDLDRLPRHKFAEISRLAILPHFRRVDKINSPQVDYFSADQRRVFPHIALGLYLATAAISLRENLDMAVVMMQPRLARHMRYFGINFEPAGDLVDYHGPRGPFFITRDSLLRDLDPQIAQLLKIVSKLMMPGGELNNSLYGQNCRKILHLKNHPNYQTIRPSTHNPLCYNLTSQLPQELI